MFSPFRWSNVVFALTLSSTDLLFVWLECFASFRHQRFVDKKAEIESNEKGTLVDFAGSYKYMGLHRVEGGIKYVEWAPNAVGVSLFGDFSTYSSSICLLSLLAPFYNAQGRLQSAQIPVSMGIRC